MKGNIMELKWAETTDLRGRKLLTCDTDVMRLEIHDDDRPQYRYSITAKPLPMSGIPGHYFSVPYNYFAVCKDVEEGKRRLTTYVKDLPS
jgi:hypothetical protein